MRPITKRRLLILAAVCAAAAGYLLFTTAVYPEPGRVEGKSAPLPHPSTFLPDRLPEFQKILTDFLERYDYRNLGWAEDKGLRDTGPFINNKSYGVHPTVKIYYSPEIMTWLTGGREGTIPDGAMIIKEQYAAPAARYQLASNPPASGFIDWTIMIKDSKGSKDGWYWAEIWKGQTIDNNKPPFAVPNAGFGLYCTRCHTSAEKEFTFVSLANIKGFPGQPLTYFTDQSWAPQPTPTSTPQQGMGHLGKPFGQVGPTPPEVRVGRPPPRSHHEEMALLGPPDKPVETRPSPTPNPAFVRFYNSIRPVPLAEVKKIPAETYDHIVPDHKGPQQFLTSDSCMGCHSAIYYGNLMVYTGQTQSDGATPVMNVSPYGEWRWSPMGLAGRDPIFYSQLDSELAYLKTLKDKPAGEKLAREVVNTCFRCHGVMGKRQFDLDHGGSADFDREFVYQTEMKDPTFKYGALARDGVSCAACHHIVDDKPPPGVSSLKYFLDHSITGQFQTGKPDELAGPFEDNVIVTDPMNNVLGAKPKHDPFIKTSRMCGSCHTIDLPVVDQKPIGHNLEQLTYLEWLNSSYQNEFGRGAQAQTCQDCHMRSSYSNSAGTLKVPLIQQPFASVEDDNYPAAEHRAPADKIQVRFRDTGFVRHQFQGLNVPLLEMFSQFMTEATPKSGLPSNEVLGVRQNDYMLTVNADLPNAIDAFVEQAQNSTASIAVTPVRVENGKLIANVTVTNKTGHRFPSGVGFRRAFIEFQAIDNRNNKVVWASGRTNELGIIVDEKDQPLPSEFFDRYQDESGKSQQHYQPHYYDQAGHTITRQDQVQIFEELMQDADGNFTTSFIRRDTPVKDNRLLPLGWTEKGPDPSLSGFFLEATHPHAVGEDSHYRDGSGTSVVTYEIPLNGIDPASLTLTATIYHQSIPPYYLKMRFDQAPDYPATKRLYYLTSNLNTSGTPLENWKLKIVSASAPAASTR
ncbi:MAG TPA: cytochrome P460 family protein [Chthoniobacterales bacterium]|nr:cytochrome P460 family protein [Chthoniobacterales bacterium]